MVELGWTLWHVAANHSTRLLPVVVTILDINGTQNTLQLPYVCLCHFPVPFPHRSASRLSCKSFTLFKTHRYVISCSAYEQLTTWGHLWAFLCPADCVILANLLDHYKLNVLICKVGITEVSTLSICCEASKWICIYAQCGTASGKEKVSNQH